MIAFGWASVVAKAGEEVIDRQADILDMPSLESAVYAFMADVRETGAMHETFGIGKVVESFMATEEKLAALGMTSEKTGWLVGVKIEDAAVWEKIVSGEYAGFSIGGLAEYEDVA